MLFNSWEYLVFFPVVWVLNYFCPQRFRWAILLAASLFFYMCWNPIMVLLLIFVSGANFLAGLGAAGRHKKLALGFGLISGLAPLFLFKYYDFFASSLGLKSGLGLLLPMGISFYTFQAISYSIDVYRGRLTPERHFGWFLLYVSFFPQLVAGPIERADRLLPELKKPYRFEVADVETGLKLVAVGLFKKMVVADTLAKGVNLVYNNLGDYSGLTLIMATVMFALQIYCDFSGYSDIARGSAAAFGVKIMKNFDAPYFSASVREFWQRWHISLSEWFKDYVYIPLGGGRRHKSLNLMITFLLSGLWHGANWTFVIWGGLNGAYRVIEDKINVKLPRAIGVIATFCLVCFSWIFFRANSVTDAVYVITHMFQGIANPLNYLRAGLASMDISVVGAAIILIEVATLAFIDAGVKRAPRGFVRWTGYAVLLFMIIAFSAKGAVTEFIYFQF